MTTSSQLEDYARQIESVNASARSLLEKYSADALTKPPAKGGWSAAECLDHVAKTAETYVPKIRAALENGRRQGKFGTGPFRYGVLAAVFIWALEPPVRMRIKAPAAFLPRRQPNAQSALDAFLNQHGKLKKLLAPAEGLDLAAIRVASPANERLKLPVGAAFGVLMAHARRHLWQARRGLNES